MARATTKLVEGQMEHGPIGARWVPRARLDWLAGAVVGIAVTGCTVVAPAAPVAAPTAVRPPSLTVSQQTANAAALWWAHLYVGDVVSGDAAEPPGRRRSPLADGYVWVEARLWVQNSSLEWQTFRPATNGESDLAPNALMFIDNVDVAHETILAPTTVPTVLDYAPLEIPPRGAIQLRVFGQLPAGRSLKAVNVGVRRPDGGVLALALRPGEGDLPTALFATRTDLPPAGSSATLACARGQEVEFKLEKIERPTPESVWSAVFNATIQNRSTAPFRIWEGNLSADAIGTDGLVVHGLSLMRIVPAAVDAAPGQTSSLSITVPLAYLGDAPTYPQIVRLGVRGSTDPMGQETCTQVLSLRVDAP
jgi:hypothetical protein